MHRTLKTNVAGLVLLYLATAALNPAHGEFGDYRRHVHDGRTLAIETEVGQLRLTAVDDASLEVHYDENGSVQLPSFALADSRRDLQTTLVETEDSLSFSVGGLTAIVNKMPLRIDYRFDGKPLLEEERGYVRDAERVGFRFRLEDDEKILGGGQRVLGMDRRGHRMPLYNKASYGYGSDPVAQMYYSLPAVFSSDKYIVVFDNSAAGWLDIGSTDSDVLAFEAVGGRSAYIVVAGRSYPSLITNYVDVTGRQPLPPRWAFGNFASRFGYRTEREARDVVRRFRRRKIPLDGIIIDIFWFGPDIKGHMGNLDWDRAAWPTPEDMIADFARDGVKTIAVTEPFILSSSTRWQDAVDNDALAKTASGAPRRFDFYFGNTGLVDIFDANARDWFWKPYAALFDQGLAGTWGDLGEPEVHPDDAIHTLSNAAIQVSGDVVHNAYGHRWAQMIYERQIAREPATRPLILMRSGFAGSQRFGMVPWTGDVDRSWRGLKPQVELSLQMGVLGLGYTHSDLGGFAGGDTFDRELYIRWLQYGAFQPIFRPHAQDHIAPEPVFHDRRTRNIVRDFVELRYRLLPYNYTLAFENSTTGMPLMRPLFFDNESDKALVDRTDAYFWGDAFLIAPITDAGRKAVPVALPAGTWFNFWNDDRHEGNRTVTIPVTLKTIPVLVRAGSFVPMVELVQTTRDYSSERLDLHYYADPSVRRASGQMYEDDGKTRQSIASGAHELLKFNAEQDSGTLTIDLRRQGRDYTGRPDERELRFIVHNWTDPVESVTFAGESVGLDRRATRGYGAHWDRRAKTLTVTVLWDHQPAALVVNRKNPPAGKPVVYQTMTRLFGNKVTTNRPWGTLEENGVGKFSDFNDAALAGIRELGTTHIWYTGVPHHALIRDYSEFGIAQDDPDVVKGRAGSPYAVKDYYNVNPDLATDPARRLEEFEALIERTHRHGMKVIIDVVPNHVARNYRSASPPFGTDNFGIGDDTSVDFAADNNFYYVVGEDFRVPTAPSGYAPLGGEPHPMADGHYPESPARWTGNGARVAQPAFDDWFETVKVNYGVRPDGSYAFDQLPAEAATWSNERMLTHWRDARVPSSWQKFRDIVLYWTDKGVDGFRYDMAEMVPVEFWSYLNTSIKAVNPDAFLLAEVYDPTRYRDYLQIGRMDFLYDKVGLYDTLRRVIRNEQSTDAIGAVQAEVQDIEASMLHFLENHDEHRIASPAFAGDAARAKPAMVVSALLGRSPTMLYFGQEVGEAGDGDPGFGNPMRTTIFDYWGVPAHQRWMNGGRFDGGALTEQEKSLREFYGRLLRFSASNRAMNGSYAEIHTHNRTENPTYGDRLFSFVRWNGNERIIVVANFDDSSSSSGLIQLPAEIVREWQLDDGRFALSDSLSSGREAELAIENGAGQFGVSLEPLESVVFTLGDSAVGAAFTAPRPAESIRRTTSEE